MRRQQASGDNNGAHLAALGRHLRVPRRRNHPRRSDRNEQARRQSGPGWCSPLRLTECAPGQQ
jgi:hypothetical protein